MPQSRTNWPPEVILVLSAALAFAAFAHWPAWPDADVEHSIFVAYNFVTSGRFEGINLIPEASEDLAQHAKIFWMTHWPPVHALLYASMMWTGLSAGVSTKILGVLCVLVGGLGWMRLTAALGGSLTCVSAVALAFPWLFFMARIYFDYKNDHLSCALTAWVFLAAARISPSPERASWGRLILAGLLAGVTTLVKYSLLSLLAGTGLYFLWLEGRMAVREKAIFTRERLLRTFVFSAFLLAPTLILFAANQALGHASYAYWPGSGIRLPLYMFAYDFLSAMFGSPIGWNNVVIQLNAFLQLFLGISRFKGATFAVVFVFVAIWATSLWRSKWTDCQKDYLVHLCFVSAMLGLMLYIMATTSTDHYNYAYDVRYYFAFGFGWLALFAVSLDRMPWRALIRSVRFYSLVVPVFFSFAFHFGLGVFSTPYASMPNSGVAWLREDRDAGHAAFLSQLIKTRGRRPDLMVSPEPKTLVEVGVPCFYTFRALIDNGRLYYSSKNIEVWAMIEPSDEKVLLSKFRKAAKVERIEVPPGFPFIVYILDFVAERR